MINITLTRDCKENQNKRYMDGKQAYEKLFSIISQLKL